MSQNASLSDGKDFVVWEFRHGGQEWRVSFVDSIARLESNVRGAWCMMKLADETAAALHAFLVAHVAGLGFQHEAAEAEQRLAIVCSNEPRQAHWQSAVRSIARRIDSLPEPWRSKARKRRR